MKHKFKNSKFLKIYHLYKNRMYVVETYILTTCWTLLLSVDNLFNTRSAKHMPTRGGLHVPIGLLYFG